MTKYYHKKGNRIVKYALLNLIADIMKSNATASFTWLDEGYENDNQRIHFSSDRHKCMLVGVGCPNVEKGIIPLKVKTEWEGEKDVLVDVNLEMQFLHIKTLEKIACEVYNTLWDPEKDDEYDIVKGDYIETFLDTYFYPEMKQMKKYKAQRSFE